MRTFRAVRFALLAVALYVSGQDFALTQAPAMPLNGPAVDVCKWLSQAEAEKVLGKLPVPPKSDTPQGSLLGQCSYNGGSGIVTVSARPASEYEATIANTTRKGVNKPVEGLAGPARLTRAGLMMQPAGKPYFVVVFGIGYPDETVIGVTRALKLS